MSSENCCEWAGGKHILLKAPRGSWVNPLGVIPWALHPSGGWNVKSISGWFRMCSRAVTCWPYVVLLYIENTRRSLRNRSSAHIWGSCVKPSPGTYFHAHQTATLQSLPAQQGPHRYLTTSLKKDLDCHQWKVRTETSAGIPLWPHDEIRCSDILFSVVTWVFMHQERNNDVITGVTLPSENKIPSIPFGSYSKALHDPDSSTLGSRLCLLALGNVIFLWEIWYLFSDGTQVLINHHLLLKISESMSSGSSLNRLLFGFCRWRCHFSNQMSVTKRHLWVGTDFDCHPGILRITQYTWLSVFFEALNKIFRNKK